MSYLQEAQIPAAHVETIRHRPSVLPARAALPLLMVLAFLHSALYAAFLPPWGLIDEAQHLHYIQMIAEQQTLPVAGDLYLSDEIIASLFVTRRWETFHWTPPPAPDPQVMGLEGHSYEAYQPPLFYLLMTPAYLALPDNMLVKVYALRGVVVLLSLVTVWAIYRSAQIMLPTYPAIPFWAGLLLAAIPERAMATSRINNDALLEVVAALFIMAMTHALVSGLSTRRSLLLGVLLGLAVWVKISAAVLGVSLLLLFWLRRRDPGLARQVSWAAVAAAPFGISLALRNLWLYGDLTGFGSFDQLHRLAPTDVSLAGIVRTVISLPNHFWLVWWKGSETGQNVLLTVFYALMALVVAVAWVRLGFVYWPRRRASGRGASGGFELPRFAPTSIRHASGTGNGAVEADRTTTMTTTAPVVVVYGVTVLLYALAVLGSYYEGMVPVIQGRFMLPAIIPFVLLLVWGLWLTGHGARFLMATTLVLVGMSMISLFGNLIPYYYYWSGVLAGTMPAPSALTWGEWVMMVFQRLLQDKPAFLTPLLFVLPILFALALVATLWVALRTMNYAAAPFASQPASQPAGQVGS